MAVKLARKTDTQTSTEEVVEKKVTKKAPDKTTTEVKPKAETSAKEKEVKPVSNATKIKEATKPKIVKEVAVTEQQIGLADAILTLEAEIAASDVHEKIARVAELKAELLGTVGEGDPELKVDLPNVGVVTVSKPSKTTIVDQKKAQEVLGDDYLLIAKAGTTDLKKYLTPEQQSEVFTYASGDRKCSVKLAGGK